MSIYIATSVAVNSCHLHVAVNIKSNASFVFFLLSVSSDNDGLLKWISGTIRNITQ